jgi:hypothetical protein
MSSLIIAKNSTAPISETTRNINDIDSLCIPNIDRRITLFRDMVPGDKYLMGYKNTDTVTWEVLTFTGFKTEKSRVHKILDKILIQTKEYEELCHPNGNMFNYIYNIDEEEMRNMPTLESYFK